MCVYAGMLQTMYFGLLVKHCWKGDNVYGKKQETIGKAGFLLQRIWLVLTLFVKIS